MICSLLIALAGHWSFMAAPPECYIKRLPTPQPKVRIG
jgi:hypothetical protein